MLGVLIKQPCKKTVSFALTCLDGTAASCWWTFSSPCGNAPCLRLSLRFDRRGSREEAYDDTAVVLIRRPCNCILPYHGSFSIAFHIPPFSALPISAFPSPSLLPNSIMTSKWFPWDSAEVLLTETSLGLMLHLDWRQTEGIGCPIYSCVFILPQSRLVLRKATPALGWTQVNLQDQIQQCLLLL